MSDFEAWTPAQARDFIAVPRLGDDKYSRGVLGVITGSDDYPGAAVLGVDAALHTGVGMLRYLGSERPTGLVLARRPEVVTIDGRVHAWLLGSGMSAETHDPLTEARLVTALESGHPTVLDAGALESLSDSTGPVVITPHHGELARLLHVDVAEVSAEPEVWAQRASESLGATVVLKGHTTLVCGPGGCLSVTSPTTWLATAGTGDALAGILGALLATHAAAIEHDEGIVAKLAATAVLVHGLAAHRAGHGGPFTVLGLTATIPAIIVELLS
ncbi:MAG: ADP/ATP-dependent (S)-NAD(P)H-hydrate dehydratase [Terrimesophilobacter sp.]